MNSTCSNKLHVFQMISFVAHTHPATIWFFSLSSVRWAPNADAIEHYFLFAFHVFCVSLVSLIFSRICIQFSLLMRSFSLLLPRFKLNATNERVDSKIQQQTDNLFTLFSLACNLILQLLWKFRQMKNGKTFCRSRKASEKSIRENHVPFVMQTEVNCFEIDLNSVLNKFGMQTENGHLSSGNHFN